MRLNEKLTNSWAAVGISAPATTVAIATATCLSAPSASAWALLRSSAPEARPARRAALAGWDHGPPARGGDGDRVQDAGHPLGRRPLDGWQGPVSRRGRSCRAGPEGRDSLRSGDPAVTGSQQDNLPYEASTTPQPPPSLPREMSNEWADARVENLAWLRQLTTRPTRARSAAIRASAKSPSISVSPSGRTTISIICGRS